MSDPFVFGIGGFQHDGNIAILDQEGRVKHASQLERFTRKKHCGIDTGEEVAKLLRERFPGDILATVKHIAWVDQYLYQEEDKKDDVKKWVQSLGIPIEVVDHHTAHLASSFYNSPFETAALLSMDSKGDKCSVKIARGDRHKITVLASVPMQYSIGRLWSAANAFVGFPGTRFAGKTMALASFGSPVHLDALLRHVGFNADGTYYFHLGDSQDTDQNRAYFFQVPNIVKLYERITGFSALQRHSEVTSPYADLAASIQELTNLLASKLVAVATTVANCRHLCLAGGVALNGNTNTAMLESGMIDDLFVQPAAGDMGLGLGGAQYVYHHILENPREFGHFSPYLGHDIGSERVEEILEAAGVAYRRSSHVADEAAALIADGNIVAWVQGREEFGPRALGNRSILVSPLMENMKEVLNDRVKHREPFRPFAGAVPLERAADYFVLDRASPYMLLITKVRDSHRASLAPIVHVDGSIRVQTVTPAMNSRFSDLLRAFGRITGVPILLNTSLNDNGQAIVSSVNDALTFFLEGNLDYLVIDDFIVRTGTPTRSECQA